MIGGIDAPGVPDGPVGFEGALGIRCIGREPISHVTVDLLERAQSPLGAGPKRFAAPERRWSPKSLLERLSRAPIPGDFTI